jgi:hypothetical protein
MGHHTYKVEELLHAIDDKIDLHRKDKWCIKYENMCIKEIIINVKAAEKNNQKQS